MSYRYFTCNNHYSIVAFVDKRGNLVTEGCPFFTGVSSSTAIFPNTDYASVITERNVNARLRRAAERVGKNMRSVLEQYE